MLQEVTSVQFTVGKLDAGMAILLSPDHHLIEFPATILPEGVTTGSIVNLTIERNQDEERRQRDEFLTLQEDIHTSFSQTPEPPALAVKSVTQTSITVRWDPLRLHAAELRGIDVYRNGQKLALQVAPTAVSAKLSGLDVNQEYEIWVVVRTSAGSFESNHVTARTHTMENLTGISVSFGVFANEGEVEPLVDLLARIGASYTDDLTTDNTHLICTVPRGPKYEKAVEWNIPVVGPEFLKACEAQGKIQPSHSFYVSNPTAKGSGEK
ncbi:Chitin synthase, class 5 [Rhizophlyctis rosea]|uniref:Chitin synthase, class 5 n=1 Tax=Rhizophlyctis rosea TaxID=64517 RepID=A0AAD5SM38_9FUNG|nr:Chitin synthase, class 5 [Rhizophlyctis rosea]